MRRKSLRDYKKSLLPPYGRKRTRAEWHEANGLRVSVGMIPASGFGEQAIGFGPSFSASGFEAIGPVRDGVGGDPRQQGGEQLNGVC